MTTLSYNNHWWRHHLLDSLLIQSKTFLNMYFAKQWWNYFAIFSAVRREIKKGRQNYVRLTFPWQGEERSSHLLILYIFDIAYRGRNCYNHCLAKSLKIKFYAFDNTVLGKNGQHWREIIYHIIHNLEEWILIHNQPYVCIIFSFA